MSTPAPAGPYTVPLYELARIVAETAAFQERCGLTYPDAAALAKLIDGEGGMKRIYYPDCSDREGTLSRLPFAVITFGGTWRLPMVSGGARNYFHGPQGDLILRVTDKARHTLREGALRDFGNFVGTLLASGDDDRPGISELSALDDRLSIYDIAQTEPPWECERVEGEANGEPYWAAEFLISYGLSGGV